MPRTSTHTPTRAFTPMPRMGIVEEEDGIYSLKPSPGDEDEEGDGNGDVADLVVC